MNRDTKSTQDGPDAAGVDRAPPAAKPMGGIGANDADHDTTPMSDTNDADRRTTTELARAAAENGASLLFAAAVAENRNGMPAEKVAWALDHDRDVARHCRGGGFMTALWDGDAEHAYTRADAANRELLESIDLLADAGVTA